MGLGNKQFQCQQCGANFTVPYKTRLSYVPKFCSKSCKTISQRNGYKSASALEKAITQEIVSKGEYMTKEEICQALRISSKTIQKFGVSVLSLNKSAGMHKPRSMFEHLVCMYLKELFPDLEEEKTFKECLSTKGYPLRFDFYVPSFSLLIEADGTQHYNPKNLRFGDRTHIEESDALKEAWCEENEFPLVRIPYSRKVTLEYVWNHIPQQFRALCTTAGSVTTNATV